MEGGVPPSGTAPSVSLPVLEGGQGWWSQPGHSASGGSGAPARVLTALGQARPALSHGQGYGQRSLGTLGPRLTSASARLAPWTKHDVYVPLGAWPGQVYRMARDPAPLTMLPQPPVPLFAPKSRRLWLIFILAEGSEGRG